MESIRRAFVCVSEQKFHSHLIKAARLVTHQDALNTFLLCLCSPLSLLSFLVPPSLLPTCLKGKMDSSSSAHSSTLCPTSHLHEWNDIIYSSSPPLLPPSLSLLPPLSKGCAPAPLAKTPSHCKRMSLSQRKQSAFIMSYLPGPPWQRVMMPGRGESVFGGQGLRL